jgi:hypothetical protein
MNVCSAKFDPTFWLDYNPLNSCKMKKLICFIFNFNINISDGTSGSISVLKKHVHNVLDLI